MKVLGIVDKKDSAIWRCCLPLKNRLDCIDYKLLDYHPKRPNAGQVTALERELKDADVLDFQYWKTADRIIKEFPEAKNIPKVLTHHNPYDVDNRNWWKDYDIVAVKNDSQLKTLRDKYPNKPIYMTRHKINLDKFQFKPKKDGEFTVLMVASRIEGNKGILPVVKAVKELNCRMIIVGRISNRSYFESIMNELTPKIEVRLDATEEMLVKSYHEADLYIFNSVDNFESGSLPVLEAMSSGTPVLAREIGMVKDIEERHYFQRSGDTRDIESIKLDIESVRDKNLMKKVYSAYKMVARERNDQMDLNEYLRLFMHAKYKRELPMVSVIIPTYNRPKHLMMSIMSVAKQEYKKLEVVVVDDGSEKDLSKIIEIAREQYSIPIKYKRLERQGYGLARARNVGAMEADGDFLLFLDDRLAMRSRAVLEFLRQHNPKTWMYGAKESGGKMHLKDSFVENFSFISKSDFVNYGGFNERITHYGALTRDTYNKYSRIGFQFNACSKAEAIETKSSSSKWQRLPDLAKSGYQMYKLYERRP